MITIGSLKRAIKQYRNRLPAALQQRYGYSAGSPYTEPQVRKTVPDLNFEVWGLVADDQRGVISRQLSDHPGAADALKVLTTGDCLDAESEDWVREATDAA